MEGNGIIIMVRGQGFPVFFHKGDNFGDIPFILQF